MKLIKTNYNLFGITYEYLLFIIYEHKANAW